MASKSRRRRKQRQRARSAAGDDEESVPRAQQPRTRAMRADLDERPPAPWGSFPLVELTVLAGIILLLVGFVLLLSDSEPGMTLLLAGLALGSIGGLETSIREHFAGYRSHTLVLAGVPALAVLAIFFVAGPTSLPGWGRALIAAAAFALAAWLLTVQFSRSSGGHRFKLTPLPGRRRR